jgi:hypothetical protein
MSVIKIENIKRVWEPKNIKIATPKGRETSVPTVPGALGA